MSNKQQNEEIGPAKPWLVIDRLGTIRGEYESEAAALRGSGFFAATDRIVKAGFAKYRHIKMK